MDAKYDIYMHIFIFVCVFYKHKTVEPILFDNKLI